MTISVWSRQWPLPSAHEVQDKLIEGRALTAADRLALFRDGHLRVPKKQEDMDRALRLAAQGAFLQGDHGKRRPVFEWETRRQTNRDDQWPLKEGDPWPAWEGEDGETFAHRAHVALWLNQGANPWVPWGGLDRDRHGPWGLPEILLAAGPRGDHAPRALAARRGGSG